MENFNYSKILKNNWEIVALFIGVTVVLALLVSLIQPFQYSASTKMLIIQKQSNSLDAYTANKSAERIAKNLVNIIYTSSFYNEVIESTSDNQDRFPEDSFARKKVWQDNVSANVISETGIISLEVYDTNQEYAANLVKNIAYVLIDKGAEYHGAGNDVEIKVVDDIFVSNFPARPNVFVNVGLAVIIGLMAGSAFVILNSSRQFSKNKKIEQKFAKVDQRVKKNKPQTEQENKSAPQTEPKTEKQSGQNYFPQPVTKEQSFQPYYSQVAEKQIITMHDHLT